VQAQAGKSPLLSSLLTQLATGAVLSALTELGHGCDSQQLMQLLVSNCADSNARHNQGCVWVLRHSIHAGVNGQSHGSPVHTQASPQSVPTGHHLSIPYYFRPYFSIVVTLIAILSYSHKHGAELMCKQAHVVLVVTPLEIFELLFCGCVEA